MSFNSLEFVIFFPLIVALYFLVSPRWRWLLLLLGSYYFYMSWKAEYALLLLASTAIDYVAGRTLDGIENDRIRKGILLLSLITNFGLLFAFKYFNFFSASTRIFFESISIPFHAPLLAILLPVGISFYTFQSASYTIDVYRRQRHAERHFGFFALYVSYFPQLVAGPIERTGSLLPQLRQTSSFDTHRIVDGLKIMLVGFFKKVVIADRLALLVNSVYGNAAHESSMTLLLATYFFAFQIYCDFSGYSDIAIGAAKVMGHNLRDNFNRPYIATTIRDFWKRWHMSLTSWFMDYLFIPLGGSRVATLRKFGNILIVFLISGLWHGANWTFVVWGALHGFYQTVGILTTPIRERLHRLVGLTKYPRLKVAWQTLFTFHLVLVSWIFFRAINIQEAFAIIFKIFTELPRLSALANAALSTKINITLGIMLIFSLLLLQKFQRHEQMRFFLDGKSLVVRWSILYALIFAILFLGVFKQAPFIYFQF